MAAYNLGHYAEAAAEFEAAYRLFLDPVLLFNIAQSYRLNGEPEKALNGYRSFLRTAPAGMRDRVQAERWRQELERNLARAHPPAAPASPPSAAVSPPTPASKVAPGPAPTPATTPSAAAPSPPPVASPAPTTPAPPALASPSKSGRPPGSAGEAAAV
jgi:hypothetical protein